MGKETSKVCVTTFLRLSLGALKHFLSNRSHEPTRVKAMTAAQRRQLPARPRALWVLGEVGCQWNKYEQRPEAQEPAFVSTPPTVSRRFKVETMVAVRR